jgi:hypothetical protein
MSKHIISASVSDDDRKFLNANYPGFKENFPNLEFEEFVGMVIHHGIESLKEESPENT